MLRFLAAAGAVLSLLAVTGPAASRGNARIASLLTPVSQTVDRCHKQCAPLLKLDSRSEARRTYGNCRSLCAGSGMVTCPDGSRVPVSNARRCGSKRSDRPRWTRYR